MTDTVIGECCEAEKVSGTTPVVVASKLLNVMAGVLMGAMGGGAVRQALLTVHEMTYENATTYTDRLKIKDAVDAIAQSRRKVEGRPSLILATTLPPGQSH